MIAIKVDWKNPDEGMRKVDHEGMNEEEIIYEFALVHHLLVETLSNVLKVDYDAAQIALMSVAADTDAPFKDAADKAKNSTAEFEMDEDDVGSLLEALSQHSTPVSDEEHAAMEAYIRSLFDEDDD